MLALNEIRRIHLIGICGTAMASIAALLKELGYRITGSDEAVYPPMSDFLLSRGIRVTEGYHIQNMRPEPDLVVVGNALSRGNPEIEYALNYRLCFVSLPEAIKDFFLRGKNNIVVAGTHGKTTTTAMIAWGLESSGRQPGFIIGGVTENFSSSCKLGKGEHFVIEGDEYDSAFFDKGAKFLHYLPQSAIVGNIEFDHADIFSDLQAVMVQFARFVNLVPQRGYLLVGEDSPSAVEVSKKAQCRVETFGLRTDADWSARDIETYEDHLTFECLYKRKLYRKMILPLLGTFNIRNALAAIGMLHHLGVPEDDIRIALESFKGVKRRLRLLAEVNGIRVYEDFAHHPTAVRETLSAMRDALRPVRLWAIYEPRSATSRRSTFQKEMAHALSLADCIALPPLYRPEKIPQGERLDLRSLVEDLHAAGRSAWKLEDVDGIISFVCRNANKGDVIVILSNGGFDGIYDRLPQALKNL